MTAGSFLVVYAGTGNNGTDPTGISDTSGRTWTLKQNVAVSAYSDANVWTSNAVASSGSITVTVTVSNTSDVWGFNLLEFGASAGIGVSAKTNVLSGAPTLNITPGGANSALVVVNMDWNAVDGTSRVWRTGAGAFTEQTYTQATSAAAAYGGYHADAGPAGTYAVGLSAPTGQKYSIIALEVLGSSSAAPDFVERVAGQYGGFF